MPRRTGTRTAAQIASTVGGAVAYHRIIAKFLTGCAVMGAKISRPIKKHLLLQAPSGLNIFLVGFHSHRPDSEAERDADDDRKQCNPHGVPPTPLAQVCARQVRRKQRAKSAPVPKKIILGVEPDRSLQIGQ